MDEHDWTHLRNPVPPQADDPGLILSHIALMAECQVCFPDGYDVRNSEGGRLSVERSGFCSRHRDPILLALGWVHGWTHKGGMPQWLPGKCDDCGHIGHV
jgi:hypothetical protein